jgi:hypothetical protein
MDTPRFPCRLRLFDRSISGSIRFRIWFGGALSFHSVVIHPIDKKILRGLLPTLPEEYLYGLRSIELRPRKNAYIGYPFGQYRIKDKVICLFSLPFPTWTMPKLGRESRRAYRRFGASVVDDGHTSHVHWPDKVSIQAFQTEFVLLHELGHHYQYRFKTKKPLPADIFYEELLADALSRKLAKTKC